MMTKGGRNAPVGQKPPTPLIDVTKTPVTPIPTPVPVNAAEITAKKAVQESILQAVEHVIGQTATKEQVSTIVPGKTVEYTMGVTDVTSEGASVARVADPLTGLPLNRK